MSIFTPDTSIQLTGNSTNAITYNTKDNPNIAFHSRAGIYNSADNVIKIFTNNSDALTINSSGQVICNGTLITDISWDNIAGKPFYFAASWNLLDFKPSVFPTNWDNVASKPSIFPTNWDNVASKPTIFATNWDNVASKPTNFQSDWNSTILNRPLIFTQSETSNIFTTSNVIQNTQDFISYSKLAGRPSLSTVATSGLYNDLSGRPSLAAVATSGLFNDLSGRPTNFQSDWNSTVINRPTNFQSDWNTTVINRPTNFQSDWTSTVINKPTNFQSDWTSTVINKPDIFTKTETSNIFTTSNVLSNTSNTLYNNVNLTNYFTKIETSNIFTTSNIIQNSVGFIDYNNLANKPVIPPATTNFWTNNTATDLIYNNTGTKVVINGSTIDSGINFKVFGNSIIQGTRLKITSTLATGDFLQLLFQDPTTGFGNFNGCAVWKDTANNLYLDALQQARLISSGFTRLAVATNGNIGIGINHHTPVARLHITADTDNTECKILMNDGGIGKGATNGCALIKDSDQNFRIVNYQNNDMIFYTNNLERMRILANGNVSIPNLTIGSYNFPNNTSVRSAENNERFYFTTNGNSKYNSLTDHLFTVNGSPKMTIANAGVLVSDSFTLFTPTAMLHIHKETSSADVMIRLTDTLLGSGAANGVVLWKDTNQDGRLWNYQLKALIFGTNNAERMRIKDNGYIGIGDTNCAGRLTIKSAYDNANDGIIINATDDGTATEKYMLKIYPYVVGAGAVGYRFRVINSPSSTTVDAISIDNTGIVYFANQVSFIKDKWQFSSDGKNRLYFGNNGRTYFGSQDGYEFRNNNDGYLGMLTNGGFLGLGVGTPSYRLHIAAGSTNSGNNAVRYFNAGTALTASTTSFTDCCANFGSTILVGSWIASSSDIRIKKEIRDVDKDEALQTLLKLTPRKYKYIDNVVKSDREVIGFVAQEVKEIIPDAVNDKNNEVIPNIYKCYNINGNIIATDEDLRNQLKVGDKIEYLLENQNDRKQTNILEITDTYIKIDITNDNNDTKIFIVGKYVNDFQTISKDDIFSLNVSATQELYRIIKEQQSIINDLKNRIEILENKN